MTSKQTNITPNIISQIAELTNVELDGKEIHYFAEQFNKTLATMQVLNSLETDDVLETNQVTGLVNIFRDDIVDENRILSQEQALSNADNTHNGYFVVNSVL